MTKDSSEKDLEELNPADSTEAAEINRKLALHQKRSAATETIFTIALLLFSYLQVSGFTSILYGNVRIETGLFIPSTVVFFTFLGWALLVGYENLIEVTQRSYEGFMSNS